MKGFGESFCRTTGTHARGSESPCVRLQSTVSALGYEFFPLGVAFLVGASEGIK